MLSHDERREMARSQAYARGEVRDGRYWVSYCSARAASELQMGLNCGVGVVGEA